MHASQDSDWPSSFEEFKLNFFTSTHLSSLVELTFYKGSNEQKSEKILGFFEICSDYSLSTDETDLEILGTNEPSLEILGTRSNPARSDNAKKMH